MCTFSSKFINSSSFSVDLGKRDLYEFYWFVIYVMAFNYNVTHFKLKKSYAYISEKWRTWVNPMTTCTYLSLPCIRCEPCTNPMHWEIVWSLNILITWTDRSLRYAKCVRYEFRSEQHDVWNRISWTDKNKSHSLKNEQHTLSFFTKVCYIAAQKVSYSHIDEKS